MVTTISPLSSLTISSGLLARSRHPRSLIERNDWMNSSAKPKDIRSSLVRQICEPLSLSALIHSKDQTFGSFFLFISTRVMYCPGGIKPFFSNWLRSIFSLSSASIIPVLNSTAQAGVNIMAVIIAGRRDCLIKTGSFLNPAFIIVFFIKSFSVKKA